MGHSMNLGQSSGKSGVVIFKRGSDEFLRGPKSDLLEDVGEDMKIDAGTLSVRGLEGDWTKFRRIKMPGIVFNCI
jgi:hypothetical protein